MSDKLIMRVMPENVTILWDQVAPMLEYDPGYGVTHDAEDIRALVMASQAHLWIQWNETEKRVEAINITMFQTYPRGVMLNCWITCAEQDAEPDWEQFYWHMKKWAKEHKCKWILGQGRVGWMRKFPDVTLGGLLMRMPV